MLTYEIFIAMFIGISSLLVYITINTSNELKQLEKRENEIINELIEMRKIIEEITIKINNEPKENTHIDIDTVNIDNSVNINNSITINNPKPKDFIHRVKDKCAFIDNKYIINKNEIAVIMDDYNKHTKRIFDNEYMIIYGRFYITESGISYIRRSKYVKSVCHDFINRILIIEFYDDNIIDIDNDTIEDIKINTQIPRLVPDKELKLSA